MCFIRSRYIQIKFAILFWIFPYHFLGACIRSCNNFSNMSTKFVRSLSLKPAGNSMKMSSSKSPFNNAVTSSYDTDRSRDGAQCIDKNVPLQGLGLGQIVHDSPPKALEEIVSQRFSLSIFLTLN